MSAALHGGRDTARKMIFWEVDAQVDFLLPGGKLYVPGAEKIIPAIGRLVNAARQTRTLVISSRCAHAENDPEFERFPPHCLRGTPGAEIIPQGMLEGFRVVPNDPQPLAPDVLGAPQIVIEKQMLDVFTNRHTEEIVELCAKAEYAVFGVVTEYCVGFAARGLLARGRQVAIVTDAIETLDAAAGSETISDLKSLGARTITTAEAIAEVAGRNAEARDERAGR